MKRKFIILLWAGVAFLHFLKAQCPEQKDDIYTPNNSPVVTWAMCELSLSGRRELDDSWAILHPAAQQIKTYDNLSSTYKFNCHGYAWLRTEEGIDRWIGRIYTTDENIYMEDGSYTQVSQPMYPGKVSWVGVDHSAVTTSHPDTFISKWTMGPLMKHHKNDHPYGSNSVTYWVRTPTISGPLSPILLPITYYLAHGQVASWSISNGFVITGSTATSATVKAVFPFNGQEGTLTAVVNGIGNISRNIQASQLSITGSHTVYSGSPGIYGLNDPMGSLSGTPQWSVSGPFSVTHNPGGLSATVAHTGSNYGEGTLIVSLGGSIIASKTITGTPLPPTIAGSSSVCFYSPSTFTVTNAPADFTWDKSSNLTLSGTGTSVSVTATGSGNSGWISIKSGTVELVRHNVSVLVGPTIYGIDGPDNVGSSGSYSVITSGNLNDYTTYQWSMSNAPSHYYHIYNNGSSVVDISFDYRYSYYLCVTAYNVCNSYYYQDKLIHANGTSPSYAYYPNPAFDVLNIEINPQALAKTHGQAGGDVTRQDITYDVRLYNGQGNLLRHATAKGGNLRFNVANLVNGIYYLHVYDGTGNTPEIRQIVVEH
ncbi:MAG: T9SS type A sorting domain-containing protein [Bacteroidales bacterium]|jgi:hypothetical protein|nr:T9SS type A sorting domain-containing protein [Bacteroidales bacterium]